MKLPYAEELEIEYRYLLFSCCHEVAGFVRQRRIMRATRSRRRNRAICNRLFYFVVLTRKINHLLCRCVPR